MKILEPKYTHDLYNGIMSGDNVQHDKKYYKEIDFIYENKDNSLDPDTLMYEVYSINEGGENALLMGMTVMYPVTVCGECNLTRGHFHLDRTEPEIYFGCGGEGLLIYMKEDGEIFAEKVFKGSIHYIHGEYAHRLVNTGDEVFKVGAFWRELAGHDYQAIEDKPFTYKVYKENGKIVIK